MIEQIAIALLGVTAVWLSQAKTDDQRKWASVFGLCGQPFWFYATFQAEQWGIFILCIFYTISWYRGFRNYWMGEKD